MEIILWIVFGAIVGWLASLIMKTDAEQGAIANIIVGILGAVVGGFLWKLITGDDADSLIGQLLVALIGAVLVLAVWKAIRRPNSPRVE